MAAVAVLVVLGLVQAGAQVNVTTYHNDIGRTGQNLNETTLNTGNVNSTMFGKLFAQPVDGQIYAQPLYLSGITVNGATHNVIFVETENDSVYAFDADSNGGANAMPLWQASMLSAAHGAAAGATTVPSSTVGFDINPQVGITGTPVIDPVSGTLYVVSASMEGGNAVQRLHALDVTTGLEKFGGPVVIKASVPGTGSGSVNGTLAFDPLWQNQRPGLLLLNGIVWIGFGSHNDNGPWHGWVIGYNASTLQQTGAYCTSPDGTGAGIWMSGDGLPADQLDTVNHPFGRMFIPTGNGDYNATSPYTNTMDYGDSHLDLDLTNGAPTVTDEFTTNQQAALDSEDEDVASGGLMVIPTQTTGSYPHLAVQAGKAGTLFLLNRDNLGGYNATSDQIVQEQAYAVGDVGVWSTPAYWNGNVYYWGRSDHLKSFALSNGLLSTAPTQSSETYGYPGATPSISANGASSGIVWTVDTEAYPTPGPAILQAHDASNVATTLYSSATNAGRDSAGDAVKFAVPTVVNGKVYVSSATEVDVYGLLNGITQTDAPVITPGSETYAGSIPVTITDATPGATIYYTTNGAAANAYSPVYTGPFTVSSTETVNAVAGATVYLLSAQASASYVNSSQASAVVFSLPTGTYNAAQTLTLTDTSAGASIYYTTDGSTPSASSTLYTGPIAVGSTETVTAIAIAPGLGSSPILAQTYTIVLGATGISFSQGFAATAGQVVLVGSAQLNDSRLQLTDGLLTQAGAGWYQSPVNIQAFTNDFTFQLSNPVANGITFTIQNSSPGSNALGANGSGLAYSGIAHSVAIKFDFYTPVGQGTDSTGLYVNGATPTTPAIDLSTSGINLLSDDEMAVHMVYQGTALTMTITDMVTGAVWSTSWTINIPSTIGSNTAYVGFTGSTGGYSSSQKILTWTFLSAASGTPTATPAIAPPGGTFVGAQSVTLSDATAGANIYYTTNGTNPSTSSTLYSGPIPVNATETINAFAVQGAAGSPSAVATAAFTVTPSAPTPVFTPPAGTYTSAQTVAITDTAAGATIYYTTNGTAPTTSSPVYSAPVTVAANETLNAIAVASGYTTSAVGTAVYSIQPPAATPAFSPAAGTYTTAQSVALSDATAGATIYYTTNGSTPTTSSAVYSAPISVSATETVNAIAVAPGYSTSALGSAAYTITAIAPTPTFSPGAGSYPGTQAVTISDAVAGATIYYTTNGIAPTTASAVYTGPITVASSETVSAIAVASGFSNSSVGSAAYTIAVNPPAVNFASGFTSTGLNLVSSSIASGALVLTDGGGGEQRAAWFTTPVNIQAFTSDFTFQQTAANADGFTFALQNSGPGVWAVGSNGGNLGYATIPSSLAVKFDLYSNAGEGSDSTGFYTNGAVPTVPAIDMTSSGVNLHSGDVMHAHITYDGATLTLLLTDTVTGASFTTSQAINIPTTIGSNTAYVGFTGGTGGLTATQKILTWVYTAGAPVSSAAAPLFSPAAGAYTSSQTVSISDSTSGATIYYTTNGTTPTTASAVYSAPIPVSATETIQAIATATGLTASPVTTGTYTIAAPAPTFLPAAGTYTGVQTVTLGDAVSGASIYYTTNGAAPTTSSTLYTGPISVAGSETIEAIAVAAGLSNSSVATAAYSIAAPAPTFQPAAGTYNGTQTVTLGDAASGASIYYTTNGTTPTASSTLYSGPITVSTSETVEAIAVSSGLANSAVASAAYTIQQLAPAPTFLPAAGTYTGTQTVTIGDSISGGAIYYTTNGSAPTTSSTLYTAPVTVASSETLKAIEVSTGYANSAVASAGYTIQSPAATPAFSPAGGTFAGAQTVTISDATPGAAIYYTTNGTTPTTGSTPYTAPIAVSASETVQAIATASGYGTSAVGTAAYVINGSTSAPAFSPAAGTYTSAQTVTLSDATPGAQIYYTTNGATPTTSSTLYSGPIAVSATETVQAIALATGYTASAASSATYTITPPAAAPVFTPGAGTYVTGQSVTIADASAGATIYYTTNGTTPTTSSPVYAGPVAVSSNETLSAMASGGGYSAGPVTTAAYVITPPAATPAFSPAAGTYSTAQTVSFSDATPGAAIYYTTNGSTPTTSSTLYSSPITVSASETVNAIAVAPGYSTSALGSAAYSITPPAAAPTFSPATGTYTTAQSITLSDATPGAAIYYTTNGTTPTTSSTPYTGPIPVSATETINAIATASGYASSPVSSSAYTITAVAPVVNFASSFTSAGLNFYGSSIVGGALQLTDGGTGETRSAWFTTPVNVQAFTTDFSFQLTSATADGFTFVLQNSSPGIWAVGSGGAGLGYGGIGSSVAIKFDLYNNAGEGSDSTGFYTAGATPTVPSVDMTSSGVSLHSGDVLHAHVTYDGTTLTLTLSDTVTGASFTTSQAINIPTIVGSSKAYAGFTGASGGAGAVQQILNWTYVPSSAAATPSFSPAAGTYVSAQTVTISDTTAGATIYYTTNGTTPTTSSAVYAGPVTVSANETLNAIATAPGSSTSAVGAATYTITPPAATPTFSEAAGSYPSAQTIALSDSTAGATIYYTTNGTTPTTSSAVYSAPIAVGATETLNAIAVAPGFSSSAVASAVYTITITANPTFSPAPGAYTSVQNVTISDTTSGASIYYTTNGSTPTTSSTLYTGPVSVGATETLNAIAVLTGYSTSATVAASYTITLPAATPTFSPAAGTYASAQTVSISDSSPGTQIYYTTNGSVPTTSSMLYSGPITVSGSETVSAIATGGAYSASPTGSAAYTITTATATPAFSPAAGTYTSTQTVTISDATSGARIYYTTNGTAPTTASTLYSGPIAVSATETLNAIAVATGYTQSATGTAAYTITPPAATPAFSPAAGSYTTAQTVTISDATSGATIYYTTNGTTPTTSSAVYSGPITVSATEVVDAIAIAPGYSLSSVGAAPYTIGAAPPVVNYASAFTSSGLNFYGASVVGGALELTDGGGGETHAAWYTTPVNVQAFTTSFSFQLTSASADGFTFTLQNAGAGIWAVGGGGGGLGYQGLNNSVAVKFDLYNNSGEGSDSTGFYTGGAAPTVPSVDMTSSGVNLHSGDKMNALLVYNGTTLTLTLTDTVTGASFTNSQAINIPSVVGGNTAYAGFTGTTGGLTAIQQILNWTYTVN